MLTKIFILLTTIVLCITPAISGAKTATLFYTIQIISYGSPDKAAIFFNKLQSTLSPTAKKQLRVELISSFYNIRAGKFDTKEEALKILPEVQNHIDSAYIMKAYILEKRIIQSLNLSAVPPKRKAGSQIKPRHPLTSKAVSAIEANPKITITEKPEEHPQEEQLKVNKLPKPGTQAFIDYMLNKYLGQKVMANPDQKSTKTKTSSFPNTPECLSNGCHAKIKSFKNLHFPVQNPKCTACHTQTNKQHPVKNGMSFKLVAPDSKLCYQCHPNKDQGKVIHQPIKKGKCLICHVPHGSNSSGLLVAGSAQFNQQKLCFKCHEAKSITGKYKHGPVDLGACTYCHNPHNSEFKNLLKKETQDLCFDCHTQIKTGLKESKYIHTILKTKGCVSCHDSHASKFPHLLNNEGENFCFSCHPAVEDLITKSKTKHAGLYLEKQCATCHLPHFSKYKNLLNRDEKSLCLTCHGNKNNLPASYRPVNIEKELTGKQDVHAPVRKGECSKCHEPHGSPYASLLTKDYPKGIYAPYSLAEYAFCFTCHDKRLLAEPGQKAITNFRNGSINLHYTHVAIDQKGRTCKACHQAHASDGPKLISRTGAPFGSWTMSIDFQITKTGGSCTPSCHRKMSYDRDNKVDNSIKKSFGKYYIDYKSKE